VALELSVDPLVLGKIDSTTQAQSSHAMKNRRLAVIGILLLLGMIFWVDRARRSPSNRPPGGMPAASSNGGADPSPAPSHASIKSGNPVLNFIAAYQTPIEFYGKVVDQHGTPVAGASVKILPFDNAFGNSDTQMLLESDSGGLFSVKGLKGLAMGVQVKKNGYMTLPDLGFKRPASAHRIEYGLDGTRGARFKDPNNPTLFTLHRIGPLEPMVYVAEKQWRLPDDGSPRRIALDSKNGTGSHPIEFRFSSDWGSLPNENASNSKLFNWKLDARIPGGGFCVNPSEYAFEAPESGYQETISIEYSASLPREKWKTMGFGRYFVKFADGTYARIRFSVMGASCADDNPLLMTSWMNLKPGSRNLSSDKWDPTIVSH
jgi:hypothetical protein